MDDLLFASSLIDTFRNVTSEPLSDVRDSDLKIISQFAAMPELRAAREAAARLREGGKDIHPFANRIIVSALDELGL
jgi:hypothetical protein